MREVDALATSYHNVWSSPEERKKVCLLDKLFSHSYILTFQGYIYRRQIYFIAISYHLWTFCCWDLHLKGLYNHLIILLHQDVDIIDFLFVMFFLFVRKNLVIRSRLHCTTFLHQMHLPII